MNISEFFNKLSQKLKIDFADLSELIEHNLSAGESREEALRKFLIEHLPSRIGIDSGFVIDSHGNTSKQIDIILFDKNYVSYFTIGGNNFYTCETVIAVGEVKSNVSNKKKLLDCLNKIKSVKTLDRFRNGETEMVTGPGISITQLKYDPERQYRDQIFGFIFSSKSMSKESFLDHFREWREQEPRKVWPNAACFYDDFFMSYEVTNALAADPNNAKFIYTTKEEDTNQLLLFYLVLYDFINKAHIARPSMFSYCGINSSDVDYHDL